MNYELGELLKEFSERNEKSLYEPAAVGVKGIRKRSEIYTKDLSKDYSKNKIIRYGTFVIGMGTKQIDSGVLCSNDVYSVSPAYHTFKLDLSRVFPDYFQFFFNFKTPLYSQLYMMSGARQGKSVDIKGLLKERIDLPSLDEQKTIANKLYKIQSLKTVIDNEINDFDEFVLSSFLERFGSVEETKPLSELTDKITDGSHLPPKGISFSKYLMLSSQNVHEELVLDDVRFITKEDFEKEDKRTNIQKGDVLLTIVGTIGRTHVVKEGERFVFQRSVAVIKPKKGVLNGTFLSVFLKTPEAVAQLESGGHGTSQKGIYLNDLKKVTIPIVDFDEQIKFEKFVVRTLEAKSLIVKESSHVDELLEIKMEEYFE